MKLPPDVFFPKKCIYILALEMAGPGNRHCANYIGTLSFSVTSTDRHMSADQAGKEEGGNLLQRQRYTIVISLCFRLHLVLCSFRNYSCVDLLVFCSTPTHSTWRRHAKCVFVCIRISRGGIRAVFGTLLIYQSSAIYVRDTTCQIAC